MLSVRDWQGGWLQRLNLSDPAAVQGYFKAFYKGLRKKRKTPWCQRWIHENAKVFNGCVPLHIAGGDCSRERAAAAGERTPGGAGDPALEAARRARWQLPTRQALAGEEGIKIICSKKKTKKRRPPLVRRGLSHWGTHTLWRSMWGACRAGLSGSSPSITLLPLTPSLLLQQPSMSTCSCETVLISCASKKKTNKKTDRARLCACVCDFCFFCLPAKRGPGPNRRRQPALDGRLRAALHEAGSRFVPAAGD